MAGKHLPLHTAKKLGRNADVRSYLLFGQAIDKCRITAAKIMITFFGSKAQIVNKPLLIRNEGVLGNDPEKAFKLRDVSIKPFLITL